MKTTLSGLVTCPRCGPDWGLILLPERVKGGWVEEGVFGCPNCREHYPIVGGEAHLGVSVEAEAGRGEEARGGGGRSEGVGGEREAAVRMAALLGLAGQAGPVVLVGEAAAEAGELAALVPDAEVVAVVAEADASAQVGGAGGERGSWSVLRVSGSLPLRSRSATGVALTGWAAEWVEEGARVVGPGGRLLVEPAPPDAAERVEAAGLGVLVAEAGTLVAGR